MWCENSTSHSSTAPLTGAAQPLQAAQAGGNSNSRRDAVTNYEVDKTVRVTRNATGTVKRLNAAVVVNHRSTTDAKGKTSTTPLTQDELKQEVGEGSVTRVRIASAHTHSLKAERVA